MEHIVRPARVVHMQPKAAICQEGDDEPDEQGQGNQDGDDHVAHFIAEVHKDLHDVGGLQQGHDQEHGSRDGVRYTEAVAPQAQANFSRSNDGEQYCHLHDAIHLLLAGFAIDVGAMMICQQARIELALVALV